MTGRAAVLPGPLSLPDAEIGGLPGPSCSPSLNWYRRQRRPLPRAEMKARVWLGRPKAQGKAGLHLGLPVCTPALVSTAVSLLATRRLSCQSVPCFMSLPSATSILPSLGCGEPDFSQMPQRDSITGLFMLLWPGKGPGAVFCRAPGPPKAPGDTEKPL